MVILKIENKKRRNASITGNIEAFAVQTFNANRFYFTIQPYMVKNSRF